MKKILFFIIVSTLIFRSGERIIVPVLCLFFVYSLKTYGMFGKEKESRRSVQISSLPLVFGLVLCGVLMLHCAHSLSHFFFLTIKSINVFSQYLMFFSLIVIMHHKAAKKDSVRLPIVVCALFPCISAASDNIISDEFTAVLFVISVILLAASVSTEKRASHGHP